ncbi:GPW/gp25 family protein [Micromonospora sp. CB01531]|uniref:GPW/gp25 family protein n=1 Tax=Micromonospora sp. CB01531 TaxID=1718947 RepID=UPI00093F1B0F|nr:GPW/gp25 family protein [Micromonospora sp. CB01531]OKI51396.1 hypothetical protein A6A27_33520 [Micromonospora sp. CB01531]
MTRALSFPFHADDHGAAATSPLPDAVRQQVEQILLTIPGERVDRPDFGCGIQLLVFEAATPTTAISTEHVVRTALHRHLADLIDVEGVRVSTADGELRVEILYVLRATGQESALTVTHPLEVRA